MNPLDLNWALEHSRLQRLQSNAICSIFENTVIPALCEDGQDTQSNKQSDQKTRDKKKISSDTDSPIPEISRALLS